MRNVTRFPSSISCYVAASNSKDLVAVDPANALIGELITASPSPCAPYQESVASACALY